MSGGVKAAIIAGVIIVVVVLAAIVGGVIIALSPQPSSVATLPPNVQVTDSHASDVEHCILGSGTTAWSFSATLVNTGGRGYVQIAFQINSATVTSNNYFVNSQYSLPISDSVTLNVCEDPASSTFDIIVLSQTPA
jgi:hypothetical protein